MLIAFVLCVSGVVYSGPPIGTGQILIANLAVDVDTRPDIPDRQYRLVAVKDFPTAITTTVALPPDKLGGYRVRGRLSGPGLGSQSLTLQASAGGRFEIGALGQEGLYFLDDIHLVDASGTRVVNRDPTLPRVEIRVIDEVIVSEVTTRQLSTEEIEERGIVIDEDNFTVFDFAVALSIEETEVLLEAPVIVPNTPGVAVPRLPNSRPIFTRPEGIQVPSLDIPNFRVEGLMVQPIPEGSDRPDPSLPALPGLIIIPGDVGFLNQFFSAILIVANVAPDGSNLTVTELTATIVLPPGDDGILGSGDDVLRLGETEAGAQAELPVLRVAQTGAGEALLTEDQFIRPGERGKAEFVLEGLREGTHGFDIDINGRLFVASRGEYFDLRGRAAGSVVVRNPTFSLVLAHPEIVRDGERYSLFVTVSNTSDVEASLFRLRLSERSLSGTVLVPGTADGFTLPSLAPGQSETFEFRLESRRTGQVGATYLSADDGLTGSFVLQTGVGETGIPLSPDTLVLPSLADRLPDPPPLERDLVRMLGQAWSAATAPAGSLPEGMPRPSREGVYTRATIFSVLGLRELFGESIDRILSDWTLDYLETGGSRIDDLYGTDEEIQQAIDAAEDPRARAGLVAQQREKARVRDDFSAFDQLRRESRQGRFVLRDLGQVLRQEIDAGRLADALEVQEVFADSTSGRTPYLSAAIGRDADGVPARLRITDSTGARAGAVGPADPSDPDGDDGRVRELPRAGVLPLLDQPGAHMELAIAGDIDAAPYVVEVLGEGDGATDLGILYQGPLGLRRLVYEDVPLAPGSVARLQVANSDAGVPQLALDLGGDGAFEQQLAPSIDEARPDLAPSVLTVRQWGKGAPRSAPTLEDGDGFGRMVVVVFSEPVNEATAEDPASYVIDDNDRNRVAAVVLQPDRRIAFLLFEQGIDPAAPVEQLRVSGVEDLVGNPMTPATLPIVADPEMNFGGSLSGVVRRAGGAPVPGAVLVYSQPVLPFGTLGLLRLETDAEGRYSIDFVINNPLGPGIIQAFDPETGEEDRLQVQPYYAGQQLRGDLILRGYGAIAGRVLDEDGSPVGSRYDAAGNLVYAVGVGVTTRTGELTGTLVEPDGSFLVSRVPMGAAIVKVDDPGMGRFGVVATSVPAAESLVDVDVIVGSRRGNVAGRVLRAGGAEPAIDVPVIVSAEAPIRLTPEGIETAFGPVAFAYTDAGGGFELADIPPGDIRVESFDQATYERAEARAVLQPDGRAEVTLIYPGAGGIVRGLVVQADGDPAPFAEVAGGPSRTRAGVDGRFELTNFPIGSYRITARDAALPTFGSETVDILSGGDIQEVQIRLFPLGTITGRVLEANGQDPISGVEVLLIGQGGVMARRQSDLLGRFTFSNVPAYNLRDPSQFADYGVRATQGTFDGGEARVALRFGGEVANADIVFRGRGPVRGRLVQANGTPAAGSIVVTVPRIRIIPAGGDIAAGVIADRNELATSIIEGYGSILDEFDVGLPSPAEEFLAANEVPSSGTDFPIFVSEKLVVEVGPDASGVVDGRFELPPQLAGPVAAAGSLPFLDPVKVQGEIPKTTIASERLLDFGDIVLTSSVGEVSGTVLMPDGLTPVGADVRVTLEPLAGAEIEVLTDENGSFDFPLVPTGSFRLIADTGVPALGSGAATGAEVITNAFADTNGERLLNVRLFGSAEGFLPPDGSLSMDVRLQGAGSVLVQVEQADGTPAQGAVVRLDTLSDVDEPLDADFTDVATDAAGQVELLPVTEGDFQLSATLTGARGFAAERMPTQPMDGLSQQVRVVLGQSIAADGAVTEVQQLGTVRGTLFEPDGTAFGGQGKIQVKGRSTTLTTTTLADGSFSVAGVPAGFLRLEALDRNTNRSAEAEATLIGGDEILVDLTLGTTGSVAGAVLLADGATRVARALVTLRPAAGGSVLTQGDAEGRFGFSGIPEGPFTLTAIDLDRDLQGTAGGIIAVGAEDLELDVLLRPAGAVAGVVYAAGVMLDEDGTPADADGVPWPDAPVAPFAQLQLTRGVGSGGERRDAVADADGGFLFEHLPLDTYRLTARHQTDADGQVREVRVTGNGETVDGSVALRGLGEVRGSVRNATDGGPVASARVTLASQSPFARGSASRLTDASGAFAFTGQPLGGFSLTAVTTIGAPRLGAAADGVLTADGQVLVFEDGDADPDHDALRLEDVGGVVGRVLLDGEPMLAAVVTLTRAGTELVALTEADGTFAFEGLPLGSYGGEAADPFSGARNRFAIAIAANNELVDLGDLVLDGVPPEVVATEPQAGSSSLPIGGPVAVTFSEPMDPASITATSFRVRIGGVDVAGAPALSADGRTARFVPADPFPDLTRVRVDVLADVLDFDGSVRVRGVADANGNSLARALSYELTTRDATPPTVVDLQPASGATDVPLDAIARVEFSEPVAADAPAGATLVDAGGAPVPGAAELILSDRVLVFTPAVLLEPDRAYVLEVPGPITDVAGNALAGGSVSLAFRSRDTLGPVLGAIGVAAGSPAVRGQGVGIEVTPVDPNDIQLIDLFVDGALAGTLTSPPFVLERVFAAAGSFSIEAVAVDAVGNRGDPVVFELQVLPDQPPSIALDPLAVTTVRPGDEISVTARFQDDVAVETISVGIAGIPGSTRAIDLIPPTDAGQRQLRFIIPAGLAGGTALAVQAAARDTAGQSTAAVPIDLVVEDRAGPTLVVLSPVSGTSVGPAERVDLLVQASDPSGVAEIAYRVEQGASTLVPRTLSTVPNQGTALRSFSFQSPAPFDGSLAIIAEATDAQGNATVAAPVVVEALDLAPPLVTLTLPQGDRFEPGSSAVVKIAAGDPSGLAEIAFLVDGAVIETRPLGGQGSFSLDFGYAIDAATAIGTTFTLAGRATDTVGNVSGTVEVGVTVVDETAPELTIVSPTTGSLVDPGTALDVRVVATDAVGDGVDEIMLTASGEVATSLAQAFTPPRSPAEALFTLDIPADAVTGGTIILGASASDAASNTGIATEVDLTIADRVPPRVLQIDPPDGAADISADVVATVRFDEAVAAATIHAAGLTLTGPDGPVVVDPVLSAAGTLVSLRPTLPLVAGKTYTIRVTTAVTDLAGNPVATEVASSFTTAVDLEPPRVQGVTPADGATEVSIGVRPRVVFTEAMAVSTLSGIRLLIDGTRVAGTLEPVADARGARFIPSTPLPLDTNLALELPPTLTDRAGNGLADAFGTPLTTPLIYGFKTAGFGISTPVDAERVVEGSTLMIEARAGGGLAAATVVIDVNGETLATLTAAPFAAVYPVPAADQVGSLAISATAVDAEGAVLASDSIQVEVVAGIRLTPTTLGLAPGASASLGLSLSSPQTEAVDVGLSAAEPSVAMLPVALRFEPGETLLQVPITAGPLAVGEIARNTVIHARSAVGAAAMTLSVSEPISGQDINLSAAPVGLAVRSAPSLGSVGLAAGETRELGLVLPEPVAAATTPILTQTRPDIVTVAPPAPLTAGARRLPLTLTARSIGEAEIGLRIGVRSYRLSVRVGSGTGTGTGSDIGPVLAPPVGAVVRAAPSLGRYSLPAGSSMTLALPLLEAPATAPLQVAVRSSDEAVLSVPDSAAIQAGSAILNLPIITVGSGSAEVTLTTATTVRGLTIEVGNVGPASVILAPPVMIQVPARASAGRILLPAGAGRELSLPFLPEPATETVQIQVRSLDPTVVSVPASVQIAAGDTVLTLPLNTADVDAVAQVILSGGGIERVLEIAVGQVPSDEVPPTLAPPVGIEVPP